MRHFVLFLSLMVLCTFSFEIEKSDEYDLLIKNGQIVDGTGSAAYRADLAVKGDEIAVIRSKIRASAKRVIDAKDKVVAPGFIDVHTHLEPLPLYPSAESHLQQGVTTALGGPDGSCPLPLGVYLDSLQKIGIGLNVGYLVGHNSVRSNVMALENRAPKPEELQLMKDQIESAMYQGAYGLSTGLKYLPGTFSKLDEVIELSKVAAKLGGIYTSHLREEGLGLLEGVQEAIDIAEQANIRVVLTHHKVVGQPMWGSSHKTLSMVDQARQKGLDVRIDQYPYTASFTWMAILIPSWALEGDPYVKFAERCKDPVLRDSIKKGIVFNLKNDRGGNDLRRVQIAKFNWKPEWEGKTLYDWVVSEGVEPSLDNGAEFIIQAQLHRGASCIFHAMDEKDVQMIMAHPQTMIASDGRLTPFGKGHPHPRAYGTFPRVLGHFVREKKVLELEKAIYKMSGLPAKTMGLKNRGVLKAGNKADIVIFDPTSIIDKANFQQPHQYPEGISQVIVNGRITVENKDYFDIRAGEIIRGPAYREK